MKILSIGWHVVHHGHSVNVSIMTNLPGDTGSNRWYRCQNCSKDWI